MVDFLRQNWLYLFGAALLHLLFAGLFALTLIQMSSNMPPPQLAIQAMVVDSSVVTQAAQKRQREREQAEERAREEAATARRRQEEQVALEAAEQQAERARQEQLKEREAEAREQAQREEAERQRQAAAAAAAEKQRVAEIERKQKEAAAKRQKELDAKAQAAAEADLQRSMAEEEGVTQAMQSGALGDYVATIQQLLYRKWNKPPSARAGLECEVKITQAPNGTVLSAAIGKCNGDDATKQSIQNAVQSASPLPLPKDPRLFVRNLTLIFKPE